MRPQPSGLDEILARLRRRALADAAARWALLGLTAWAGTEVVLLAWAKLRPTGHVGALSALLALLALTGATCGWATRRPSPLDVARVADARLGLDERLASALCFAGATGVMESRLRADALERARSRTPAEAYPLTRHRRVAASGLCAIAVAAALVLTPNPEASALARQAQGQAVLARARREVLSASKKLSHSPSLAGPQALAQLRRDLVRLQQARTALSALVALSQLERDLQDLDSPSNHALEQAEAMAAGDALSGDPAALDLARDLTAGNFKAAAADLEALAHKLASLSPAQRRALAKSLEKAAQAARGQRGGKTTAAEGGPSSALSNALGEAGAALAAGRAGAASEDLGAAASGAQAAAQAASEQQVLAALQAAVANAQSQVAAQAQASSGQGAGAPGRGDGSGQGQGSGQGAGQGTGQGQGAGAGEGQGSGGSGGAGRSGGGGYSGEGARANPADQVFIGGQPGTGRQVTGHELGAGKHVGTTGYQAVLPQFQKVALQGLGTQVLSPADQDLVRAYFGSLAKGK
ncbi:MAG TPA: hypothetical protein VME46_19820 [Acidimicrobiales bacterium]|nr:hypothetical protein [Acidimicrobiales bacterium]